MASLADASLAADELRRRAPEWGTLRCLRLRNMGMRWSLVAIWSELHAEPRVMLRPEGSGEATYVNHCLECDLAAPVPPPLATVGLPPEVRPVTADDLGF